MQRYLFCIKNLQHEVTDSIFGLMTKLQSSNVSEPCVLVREGETITWQLLIKGNVSTILARYIPFKLAF